MMDTKSWLLVFLGGALVVLPDPATTATGLAILATMAGVQAIR